MKFSIREANQEDYEGLCEVFEEIDTLHREALPLVFREPDGSARTKEFISGIIADENAVLFVAESGGQIIGLVQILVRRSRDIPMMVPRQYGVIDNVAVKGAFQRSGVGRALVERAHRWARDQGVTQVELYVWDFNKGAIAFYEKLGYRPANLKMWRVLG